VDDVGEAATRIGHLLSSRQTFTYVVVTLPASSHDVSGDA